MFKRKLFGSLAFRVFLSSIIFIVVPLIFYTLYTYQADYQEKLNDIFTEMHLVQKDQSTFVNEIESSNLNFLKAIHLLIVLIQDESAKASLNKIDRLLKNFSAKENLSAVFYLTVNKDNLLICTNSSLKGYENVNFTPYFNLDQLKSEDSNIFISKDPVFGHSLFITFPIKNNSLEIVGVSGASIALSNLAEKLGNIGSLYNSNVSIVDNQGNILASTDSKRLHKKFVEVSSFNPKLSKEFIAIKKLPSVNQGYEFYFNHERRFLTAIDLSATTAKIVLTLPSNSFLKEVYKSLTELASLLIFILIFGGITSFILTIRFTKPLNELRHVMQHVGHGDLNHKFHKDPLGFEINLLGEQFNQMVISLRNYIEEVKKERAFKEAYQKELQIGKEIQASLLPPGTIDFHDLKSAIYFQPAKEVAGDFYDWMQKEDNLFITIADGVGKGISGCLYAFDLRSTLRTCETIYDDLSEITIKTNAIFCEDTKESGSFVTAFLAKYQAPTKELSYINCGHNYPILKRGKGHIERLDTPGIAFGVEIFDSVEMKKITLEPNDFIIFYTDGLTDAQNKDRKLFSEKRLINIIETASYNTPDELINLIKLEISLFTKQTDQYDDITILILKI
jgi:serine phosphatase RsbU (regulator of sigma subunit)